MPEAPPDPGPKALFDLLVEQGMGPRKAYTFVQGIQEMAAANLIARFESKLDALAARLDAQNAQIAAQNAQFSSMRWVLGIGLAGITVVTAVMRIFS